MAMDDFEIRPPLFDGKEYFYWKPKMEIFVKALDLDAWDAIENGPFVPTHIVHGLIKEKPKSEWNDDDKKKVQSNYRAKHFLYCALTHGQLILVFRCETAQDVWNTLQVIYEGTGNVKFLRIGNLTHAYDIFRMKTSESIQDMQKRFFDIVNHLASLGKTFSNEELVRKVLRSLSKNWKSKVIAIAESRNLKTMTLTTLFCKLQDIELEEDGNDNLKGMELDDENLNLLIKMYGEYLDKKGIHKKQGSFSMSKCSKCGKPDNISMEECVMYQMRRERSKRKKGKKEKTSYIALKDKNMDSSDDSEDGENTHLWLTPYIVEIDEEVGFKTKNKDRYIDKSKSIHLSPGKKGIIYRGIYK